MTTTTTSFPRNCIGDFRVGEVYVRSSRDYTNDDYTFAVALSRDGLDTAPPVDDCELFLPNGVIFAMHDIIHACCGTDDISDEELGSWFAQNNVEWLN